MPPRLVVLGIVVFWLTTTSWLICTEMLPKWFPPPHEPPPIVVDLTDEVEGANFTNWHVVINGQDVGHATSRVNRLADRSFEFSSEMRFHKDPLLGFISKITSIQRVNLQGHVLGVSITALLKDGMEIGCDAVIENGELKPRLHAPGREMALGAISVPDNGIVFNPEHLANRMTGLRKGQTWRVPMLNLDLKSLLLGGQIDAGSELHVLVGEEVLRWGGDDVLCFRVDYTEPGKGVAASTWVRRRDGQVLKQHARLLPGMEMVLIRDHR